jgi:uncharacterized membrane protein
MSRLFDTRDGKFDTRRVETFSDAVLAVAITLMVLRIAPPVARDGQSVGDLFWNETVPDVIYFLITFVVIVLFWIHHHDNFTLLPRRMSAQALWLNMGFLACICLLPFGLEFFSQENATVLTVAVYAGLMAVATIFLGALGRIARGHRQDQQLQSPGTKALRRLLQRHDLRLPRHVGEHHLPSDGLHR